jgi:hypothetical protein
MMRTIVIVMRVRTVIPTRVGGGFLVRGIRSVAFTAVAQRMLMVMWRPPLRGQQIEGSEDAKAKPAQQTLDAKGAILSQIMDDASAREVVEEHAPPEQEEEAAHPVEKALIE